MNKNLQQGWSKGTNPRIRASKVIKKVQLNRIVHRMCYNKLTASLSVAPKRRIKPMPVEFQMNSHTCTLASRVIHMKGFLNYFLF